MTEPTSDFPEFDQAYRSVLVKDPTDLFEQLAAEANFNVYHSDIWRGTGRKFAELIVRECAQVSEDDISDGDACCTNTADRIARQIKKHFGVES